MGIGIKTGIMALAGAGAGSAFSNIQSLQFDGVNDVVSMGNVAEFNSPTQMTISAWFKTSATTRQTIASKTYYRIELEPTSGRIGFAVYRSSSQGVFSYTPSGTSYQDGQWHHVLCTHQVNGRQKIYVDGVLLSDVSGNTSNIFGSTLPFVIGNRNLTQTTRFNGNIDEVAFWDSELSATDVSTIYGTGTPTDLSSLSPLSWWRFEGTGTTATDSGSGGNDGTLTNGVTRSTDVP